MNIQYIDVNREALFTVIDYFLPREVFGSVLIVFAIEHVIEQVVTAFVPPPQQPAAWLIIAAGATALVAWWGEADEDDRRELEQELDGKQIVEVEGDDDE